MTSWYSIDGPIEAVQISGGFTASLCSRCGRAKRVQTADLQVEVVVMAPQSVVLTDGGLILVTKSAEEALREVFDVETRSCVAKAREADFWNAPELRQIVSSRVVTLADDAFEAGDCSCGAVRQILEYRFEDLSGESEGVLAVLQNPLVLVVSEGVKRVLEGLRDGIEFEQVA